MTSACNSVIGVVSGKEQAVYGFCCFRWAKQAMVARQGMKKKSCVLVLVSLAGASCKTELYHLASQFKKLFSTGSSLLRAIWGLSIYALSLTQTRGKTHLPEFGFILKIIPLV